MFAQAAVVLIWTLRFGRLARRLYRYSGRPMTINGFPQDISSPELLALSALAGKVPFDAVQKYHAESGATGEKASPEEILRIMRLAEGRFLYLWERCYTDIMSAKRACLFTILLSSLMVTYGAYPLYFGCFNDSRVSGYYCMFEAGKRLLESLSLGLSVCAFLYLSSNVLERTLAHRRATWKYFSARVRGELPGV